MRLLAYSVLFLVPVAMLPVVTHWLIADERAFGRETGIAYLRATAEAWSLRLERGQALPSGPVGKGPAAIVAEVDAKGRDLATARLFPNDARCFGEALSGGRRVRATWPGDVGRGQARVRTLVRLEGAAYAGAVLLFLSGVIALLREVHRARKAAREQVDYVADVSHRLKTPLTSISLCAELAKTGRLDERRQEESRQTVLDEAAKLSVIVDEVLAHVKEMTDVANRLNQPGVST